MRRWLLCKAVDKQSIAWNLDGSCRLSVSGLNVTDIMSELRRRVWLKRLTVVAAPQSACKLLVVTRGMAHGYIIR